MREREGFLHFVKRCMMNPKYCIDVSSNEAMVNELNRFMNFIYDRYDYDDSDKGTKFAERFGLVFLDKNNYSYDVICGLLHIEDSPLRRWIEKCSNHAVKHIIRKRAENPILMEVLNAYNRHKQI